MQPLRNDLLGQAMTYYQQFLEESQDDPQLRSEVAEAQFYLGNITEVVSGPEAAIPHYQQSLDIQSKQAEAPDASDEAGVAYARSLNAMGRAYQKLQRPDQAFEFYEQAVAIRQKLAEARPDSPERARELASSVMNIGLLFAAYGDPGEAIGHLRRAQTIRLAHVGDDGQASTPLRKDLGMGYFNLAQVLLGQQDAPGAAEQLRLAITEFEGVESAKPGDIANESRLANCRRALADVSAALNNVDDAIREYQAAAKLMTRLVMRNPEAPAYALDLAGVRMNLGGLLRSIDRHEEALQEMLAAIELLKTPEGETSSPRQRRDLGVSQREAGQLLILLDKQEQGLEQLTSSRQVFKALVREHPGQQDFSSELSKTNEAIHDAEAEKETPPTEKAA